MAIFTTKKRQINIHDNPRVFSFRRKPLVLAKCKAPTPLTPITNRKYFYLRLTSFNNGTIPWFSYKKRTCLKLDKFYFLTSNYLLISLTFAALPVLARK